MWLAITVTVIYAALVFIVFLAYRRDMAELKYKKEEKPYWWFESKIETHVPKGKK